MTKSPLQSAWEQLLRERPELKDLPDPDKPIRDESLDRKLESGCQFDCRQAEWGAVEDLAIRRIMAERTEQWLRTLDDPNQEIMRRYNRGESERQIARATNRKHGAVHRRIKRLKINYMYFMNKLAK